MKQKLIIGLLSLSSTKRRHLLSIGHLRFILVLTLALMLTIQVKSQVNWNEFQEPNGTIQRLTIDPRISFNSTDGDGTANNSNLRLQFLSRYSILQVKERQVMSLFLENNAIYIDNNNPQGTDSGFIDNEIFLSGSYTYYLKERRGLFLRVNPTITYNLRKNNGEPAFNSNQLDGDLSIGYGRLENISTVYQAIRLDNNLNTAGTADQAQLFEIATALRSLDYNNALDTRMRTVEIQDIYLQTLENIGYDLSSFRNISNAIDQFRFERPVVRAHGQEVAVGITQNASIGNFHNINLIVEGTLARAFNAQWHWIGSTRVVLDVIENKSNDFISANSLLSYLPSARTQIQFSQGYFRTEFSDQLNLGIGGRYFISPELSVFMNTSFAQSNSDFGGDIRRFTHDMGFKYFFF